MSSIECMRRGLGTEWLYILICDHIYKKFPMLMRALVSDMMWFKVSSL